MSSGGRQVSRHCDQQGVALAGRQRLGGVLARRAAACRRPRSGRRPRLAWRPASCRVTSRLHPHRATAPPPRHHRYRRRSLSATPLGAGRRLAGRCSSGWAGSGAPRRRHGRDGPARAGRAGGVAAGQRGRPRRAKGAPPPGHRLAAPSAPPTGGTAPPGPCRDEAMPPISARSSSHPLTTLRRLAPRRG
jgi:hypothetical protein